MNKKASLNLSINAIVILILAITMLGLGLAFMRNIFGSATQEFQEVSGTIHKQMIDQMKEGNKDIDLSSIVYDIKAGEKKQIYIGFKNTANEEKNFSINGINVNSLSGDTANCGLDKDENNVIIEYKQTPTLVQAGETVVIPINIKTNSNANKDSCFYEILIDTGKEGDKTPIPLNDGLVGYWNFDDGTADDSSGNGNDGTATSGVYTINGKFGRAKNVTGDTDYINLAAINMGGDRTLLAWSYFPLYNTGSWRTLFQRQGETYHHTLVDVNGRIGVYNSAWHSSGYDTDVLSTGWHHIVAISSSGKTQFFIDGINVGNSSSQVTQDLSRIGNHNSGQTWGAFDEIRIYNRTLSEDEIKQLYTGYDSSIQLTLNVE